jgi:predicted transcriptional regulator
MNSNISKEKLDFLRQVLFDHHAHARDYLLSQQDYLTIMAIAINGGSITTNELNHITKKKSTVYDSQALNRLYKKGYVTRDYEPDGTGGTVYRYKLAIKSVSFKIENSLTNHVQDIQDEASQSRAHLQSFAHSEQRESSVDD